MSKVDVNALKQFITDLINNLDEDQQANLMNGNAEFKYEEKSQYRHYNSLRRSVIKSLNMVRGVEKVFEGMFKRGVISFCEFYKININKRDKKSTVSVNRSSF